MGVILANLAFLAVSTSMSDEAFIEWGWRLPFIASIVLIGISLYVQLRMEDTEAFKALKACAGRRGRAGDSCRSLLCLKPSADTLGASCWQPVLFSRFR